MLTSLFFSIVCGAWIQNLTVANQGERATTRIQTYCTRVLAFDKVKTDKELHKNLIN